MNGNGEAAVVTRGLTRRFGRFVAVDNLELSIKRGEIYGFLGPNGAGKTTTIRMLCGILRPSAGGGAVLGFDIERQAEEVKNHIGYMSQRFSLYEDLTVMENVEFYASIYGLTGSLKKERMADVLVSAALEGREAQLAGTLSGGQKQRLALGCALVHRPEVLFLDEPTAGVDPVSRRDFWSLLYDLAAGGTTILVTTHYMDEAEHCNRLGFIYGARLIAEGPPDTLKATTSAGQIITVTPSSVGAGYAALRAALPGATVSILGNIVHVLGADVEESAVAGALTKAGLTYRDLGRTLPSLEDLFVMLIQKEYAA